MKMHHGHSKNREKYQLFQDFDYVHVLQYLIKVIFLHIHSSEIPFFRRHASVLALVEITVGTKLSLSLSFINEFHLLNCVQ